VSSYTAPSRRRPGTGRPEDRDLCTILLPVPRAGQVAYGFDAVTIFGRQKSGSLATHASEG